MATTVHPCGCSVCRSGRDHSERVLHHNLNLVLSRLDEQQRRWLVALESQKVGHGGDIRLAEITGLHPDTIRRGREELDAQLEASRRRRAVVVVADWQQALLGSGGLVGTSGLGREQWMPASAVEILLAGFGGSLRFGGDGLPLPEGSFKVEPGRASSVRSDQHELGRHSVTDAECDAFLHPVNPNADRFASHRGVV